jgi:hypothetical protein
LVQEFEGVQSWKIKMKTVRSEKTGLVSRGQTKAVTLLAR